MIVLLSALSVGPALAEEPEISFKSTELAPGLYVLEGVGGFAGGNIGLLTGEDGVMLIDDGLPPLIDELLEAIGTLTDDPVDLLINTHVHGDHVGGNEVLGKRGATIVAHDNLRIRLAQGTPMPDGTRPTPREALPVLTFADSITVHLNGREAFVFHVEQAHTDGDAVIHFREDDVIHAGDVLFNGLFPYIDIDSGGSVEGYIAAQKRILALCDDGTKIIAGHGPLADRDDLQASIDMLEAGYEGVRALVAAGKSREQILEANPLADYGSWSWRFITTERMIDTFLRALDER
jgi:glyoxylase-like metal-dependent hydrolase (beta-lactamase superfamily II)